MTVQAPSHKLLAAALRDSSQHLPLSLQQFQDTIPMTWQGAGDTPWSRQLSESQELTEAGADQSPRNYYINHFPICLTKQGCCILPA